MTTPAAFARRSSGRRLFLGRFGLQTPGGGAVEALAGRREAAAVAGAVPGPLLFVPLDEAPHVRARRGASGQLSLLAPVGSERSPPIAHQPSLSRFDLLQRTNGIGRHAIAEESLG